MRRIALAFSKFWMLSAWSGFFTLSLGLSANAADVCIARAQLETAADPCAEKLSRSKYLCLNERSDLQSTFELDVRVEPTTNLIKVTHAGRGFVLKQKDKKGDATVLSAFKEGTLFRRVEVTTPELNDDTGRPAQSTCFLPVQTTQDRVAHVRVPSNPNDPHAAYYSVRSRRGTQVRSIELLNPNQTEIPFVRAGQAAADATPSLIVQFAGIKERIVVDGVKSIFLVPRRYATYTPFTLIAVDVDGNLFTRGATGSSASSFGQVQGIAFNITTLQSATDVLGIFSQLDGRTYRLFASGVVDLVRNDGQGARPTDVSYINPGNADFSLIKPAVSLKGFARGILQLTQSFEENPSFEWDF